MLGVVQRLLRLVEIQVLRCAALTDQHDVRAPGNGLLIQRVEEGAARAVRLDRVARDGVDDVLVLVEHDVDDIVDAEDAPGLLDVLADGVAVELARVRLRTDHHAVVALDGIAGGNAGHDALCAAGIPGKVVILNVGKADHAVGLSHGTENIHGRSGVRRTQMHAVVRIGIDTAQLLPPALTGQMALLVGRVAPVAAQRKDESDVLFIHACGIETVEQGRQNLPRRAGAGNVRGDDGDLLAGVHDLLDGGRADGRVQRGADGVLAGQAGRKAVCMQNAEQAVVAHLNALRAGAKAEFQLHFFSSSAAPWRSALTTGSSSPVRKRMSAPPPVQI